MDRAGRHHQGARQRPATEELRPHQRAVSQLHGESRAVVVDVPTLPLFVHERLSTKAILETLKDHTRDQQHERDLVAVPRHSIADQVLRAYEHRDLWVNRMILGDSSCVMNSVLEYEGLGGQVQMIYIDPLHGVKFEQLSAVCAEARRQELR